MAGHPVRRLDFDPLNKSVQVVSPNEIKTGILELPAIGAMWEAWLLVERGFLKSKIGPIMCRCSTRPREKRWTASESSLRRTVSPPSGTTLLIIVRRTNKWKPVLDSGWRADGHRCNEAMGCQEQAQGRRYDDGDVLREGIRALSEALMGYGSVNAARRADEPKERHEPHLDAH